MAKEYYRPSELKKLTNHKVFSWRRGERSILPVQKRAAAFAKNVNGRVYTAIHGPADWDRIISWGKGFRLVNRTGDYAVVW